MEATIWIAAAIVIYYLGNRLKIVTVECQSKFRKLYIGFTCLAAVFCECTVKLVFHIRYVSIWLLLTYLLLAAQCSWMLWQMFFIPEKRKYVLAMGIKTVVGVGLLAFYYINLAQRVIGVSNIADQLLPVSTGMADIVILLSMALWIYGPDIFRKFPEFTKKSYWISLTLTPLLLFLMVEIGWNSHAMEIGLLYGVVNLLIYLILEVVFVNIISKKMIGLQFLYILAWIMGALNYYLLKFRGQPLMATDIYALRTAASVFSQYTLEIAEELAFTFLWLLFILSWLWAIGQSGVLQNKTGKKSFFIRCCSLCSAVAVLFFWVIKYDFLSAYNIGLDYWWPANTYQSVGFSPALISFWQKMKISKPEDYTVQKAENILNEYTNDDEAPLENKVHEKKQHPTIITIMNESFSDLSVLGPLSCTKEHLQFFQSLKRDPHIIEYGWNYVSTRGGGTSATEFEYLTGDSMTYVNGNIPYSSFDFSNVPSMVSLLKEQGYYTIAMHPEYAENWRRSLVYPELGFDEFLSIDSFADSERTVWNRVSDLGDYQKLIEVYENQTEPSFIFNVTMQNHGGYDELSELQPDEIVTVDEEYNGYTDLIMYESLIKKSDQALEYLISYFEKEENPVIICFFGDHQPALNSEFEDEIKLSGTYSEDTDFNIIQKMNMVPYFIWSNCDIPQNYAKKNADGDMVISTNYLGTLVQKYAGLELSSYDEFRLALREKLPVFNSVGYMTSDGKWYLHWTEESFRGWEDSYQNVQYYALFDKRRQKYYFQ